MFKKQKTNLPLPPHSSRWAPPATWPRPSARSSRRLRCGRACGVGGGGRRPQGERFENPTSLGVNLRGGPAGCLLLVYEFGGCRRGRPRCPLWRRAAEMGFLGETIGKGERGETGWRLGRAGPASTQQAEAPRASDGAYRHPSPRAADPGTPHRLTGCCRVKTCPSWGRVRRCGCPWERWRGRREELRTL